MSARALSEAELRQRAWAVVGAILADEPQTATDVILEDLDRLAVVDLVHALATTLAHYLERMAPEGRGDLAERVRQLALGAALDRPEP